jgi:hypothetical protein
MDDIVRSRIVSKSAGLRDPRFLGFFFMGFR